MSDDEERYDDAELARARALAAALDRPPSAADDPELADALAAAQTLRASGFDDDRQEAVLKRARARIDAPRRRLRYALALATGGLVAAAAAVLLLLPVSREPAPPPTPPAPIGLDVAPLTAAQRTWLDSATPETGAELERRLRDYRGQYLASLQRRYAP